MKPLLPRGLRMVIEVRVIEPRRRRAVETRPPPATCPQRASAHSKDRCA